LTRLTSIGFQGLSTGFRKAVENPAPICGQLWEDGPGI